MTIDITEKALERILELLDGEEGDDQIALSLSVTGVGARGYTYETAFMHLADAAEHDLVEQHGRLPVVIDRGSIDKLEGSVLDLSNDLLNPGLVLQNPNSPSPMIDTSGAAELTGEVAERASWVLENQINPAIAGHGGFAELVAVEDGTAFLRLGGGCQGCGMAAMTLRQGIEVALKQAVPEILNIVDVTDHASGANPYFEAAAK